MTAFVHLVGPQLAGKTYVREQAAERLGDKVEHWDAWEWYREHDVIDEAGRMDWRRRTDVADQQRADLDAWLEDVTADVAIVESSGIGTTVNDALTGYNAHRIRVEESPADEVEQRAEARGLDPAHVEAYNARIREKLDDPPVTQDQAIAQIVALAVKGEVTSRLGSPVAFGRLYDDPDDAEDRSRWHIIASVGKTSGYPLGGDADVEITAEELHDYVRLFDVVGREVPVDVNHATWLGYADPEATKARGWITALRCDGEHIEALIRWTVEGLELIRSEGFRYFSLEAGPVFGESVEDVLGWTITGGTLTNQPFLDIPALVASRAAGPHHTDAHSGGATGAPESTREGEHNRATQEESMPDIKALAKVLGVDEDKIESTVKALQADNARLREQRDEHEAATAKIAEDAFVRELYDDGRLTEDREEDARWAYQQDADRAARIYSAKVVPVDKTKGGDKPDTSTDAPLSREDAGNKLNSAALSLMSDGKAYGYPAAFGLARANHPEWATAYDSRED